MDLTALTNENLPKEIMESIEMIMSNKKGKLTVLAHDVYPFLSYEGASHELYLRVIYEESDYRNFLVNVMWHERPGFSISCYIRSMYERDFNRFNELLSKGER